jgi:hypothetical protein
VKQPTAAVKHLVFHRATNRQTSPRILLARRLLWCSTMLFVAALLALLIGVSLGLLGGGGSILTVPMLVYVLHVDTKQSIASSLFVVGVTSLVGTIAHARAGRVKWKIGLLVGGAGMIGATLGGQLAALLAGPVLLVLFAAIMLATAGAMMRGRREPSGAVAPRDVPVVKAASIGAAVGVVSGLVGAGGGFLVVPALALVGGLSMGDAVGTSLLVIALQSLAGFARHAAHTPLDWTLLGVVTVAAILGSLAGARGASRLSPATMRRAFAWLVLAMALFMLGSELPRFVGAPVAATVVLVVALASLAATWLRRPSFPSSLDAKEPS